MKNIQNYVQLDDMFHLYTGSGLASMKTRTDQQYLKTPIFLQCKWSSSRLQMLIYSPQLLRWLRWLNVILHWVKSIPVRLTLIIRFFSLKFNLSFPPLLVKTVNIPILLNVVSFSLKIVMKLTSVSSSRTNIDSVCDVTIYCDICHEVPCTTVPTNYLSIYLNLHFNFYWWTPHSKQSLGVGECLYIKWVEDDSSDEAPGWYFGTVESITEDGNFRILYADNATEVR